MCEIFAYNLFYLRCYYDKSLFSFAIFILSQLIYATNKCFLIQNDSNLGVLLYSLLCVVSRLESIQCYNYFSDLTLHASAKTKKKTKKKQESLFPLLYVVLCDKRVTIWPYLSHTLMDLCNMLTFIY